MVRLCWGAPVRPCSSEPRRVIWSVSLAWQWHQTLLSTSTLPTFVRRASIGFVSSEGSDVHSMRSPRLRWSTLLWRHVWTIATPFSLGHPSISQTSSSELWMLLLASSAIHGSMIVDSPVYCGTNCTGLTFPSGCSTSCVQRSTDVCSTRHHSTW